LFTGLDSIGKLLILIGVILIVAGGLFLLVGKVPLLGRLPGDIYVQKRGWSLYFPLTTCILISILLTLLFSFFGRR
jgi:hypothetical protein